MDKTCKSCGIPKATTYFSPRQASCKQCHASNAREKRRANTNQGLCACGQPPINGQKMCARCCQENRRRYDESRSYDKRIGDKYGPTTTKKRPGRWASEPPERVCKTCGITKSIGEFQEQNFTRNEGRTTHRHSCKNCESQKSMARVAKARARGICGHCGVQPLMEGYKWCEGCRVLQRNSAQRSGLDLRALVLLRYGRKCANCGDDRIECLEIDHIGGWGKDHKNKKGRRLTGMELMRWAKKSGFPDTIRLLCGSCHSALSYYGVLPRPRTTGDKLIKVTLNTAAITGLPPLASAEVPTTAFGPANPPETALSSEQKEAS